MAAESAAVRGLDRGTRLSGYSDLDTERWVPEEPKRAQVDSMRRGEFQRDRARVLHSHAFRRLADKTQVVSPGQDDFPRTRLTHSLEVAQIAREIGAALGCDADVCDTAGLAHDLGHPPFGHNGEQALNEVASEIGGFEGNAQTLRILTRLEAKVLSPDGGPAGLNLTRASLDAVSKYPWPATRPSTKFGVYADDLPAFRWFRQEHHDGFRSLEAQVMDWADDVAYSVHDLEDGVHSGHIRLGRLTEDERGQLCIDAAENYSPLTAADLAPILDRLLELPALGDLAGFDGSYAGQAAAKRATSELTGRFASAAVRATRLKYGAGALTRYDANLVVPVDVAAECALLKAIALHFVMRRAGIEPVLQAQQRALRELVQGLVENGESSLSPLFQQAFKQAGSSAARLRVVIDQVAALTDSAAIAWHRRLVAS